LPKLLHQANQSDYFQCVQSRQAAVILYAMLKNWMTFVLIENHEYVQFIYKYCSFCLSGAVPGLRAVPERQNEQCYREVEKPSALFLLIRINCLALCILLNIAFRAKFTRMIYVLLCRRFVCHMLQYVPAIIECALKYY